MSVRMTSPYPGQTMSMRKAALLLSLLLLHTASCAWFCVAKASEVSSVTFWENKPGTFLRSDNPKGHTFSNLDVSAAITVLLGLSPPSHIDEEGASKLDAVLASNPFHRPKSILLLTIYGSKPENKLKIEPGQHRVLKESTVATLLLPEDVTLVSISRDSDEVWHSAELSWMLVDLASLLDASYEAGEGQSQGKLIVALPDGNEYFLDLSKIEDWSLALELVVIVRKIRKHATAPDRSLIVGEMTSSDRKLGFLHHAVTKLLNYVESTRKGGAVGVILSVPERQFSLNFLNGRQLLEASSDNVTAAAAEVLTENIITYITGILLIIATIIGTCFLVKMPLTRDTLLYSGVKLD